MGDYRLWAEAARMAAIAAILILDQPGSTLALGGDVAGDDGAPKPLIADADAEPGAQEARRGRKRMESSQGTAPALKAAPMHLLSSDPSA
jgi:hypothetical protein